MTLNDIIRLQQFYQKNQFQSLVFEAPTHTSSYVAMKHANRLFAGLYEIYSKDSKEHKNYVIVRKYEKNYV